MVERWAGDRYYYKVIFNDWLKWLKARGWPDPTPEGLVAFQERAAGRERYRLLDLIGEYVSERGGTYRSMRTRYCVLRSFFLHNRVDLPRERFEPRPTRAPAEGRLTVEAVREIVVASPLRYKCVYLTVWMGLMDLERFQRFNLSYAERLVGHLRARGPRAPLRVNFMAGRKRNHEPFYTFIGRDALEAWLKYFEQERGWPKPGEPLALNRAGEALMKNTIRSFHRLLLERIGFLNKRRRGSRASRYGLNIHEFRDVARSLLEKAKEKGFNTTCAEFWMGHAIDALNYNKFYKLDPDYVERQYRIAEEYLNIVSNPPAKEESAEELVDRLVRNKRALAAIVRAIKGEVEV